MMIGIGMPISQRRMPLMWSLHCVAFPCRLQRGRAGSVPDADLCVAEAARRYGNSERADAWEMTGRFDSSENAP